MQELQSLLAASAARHSHLCPRQVLGVRFSLAASQALGLKLPRKDKRLLVILETDGCFADGVEVTAGVTVGRRTLRLEDYGKIAATFIDVKTGRALRLTPQLDTRQKSWGYAPGEKRRYYAQLLGYQVMPVSELLSIQEVQLCTPLEKIISQAGLRISCDVCQEDIINGREVHRDSLTLCRACAGPAYYSPQESPPSCQT